jgi:hypothetical protein
MNSPTKDGAAAAADQQAKQKGMVDLDDKAANALIDGMFADVDDSLPVELPEPEDDQTANDAPDPDAEEKPDSSETTTEASESDNSQEEDPDELLLVEFDQETGAIKSPTPRRAKELPTDVDESKLSPEEARRLWQSRASKAEQAVTALQTQLAAIEARINQSMQPQPPQSGAAQLSADSTPATFDKTPQDFMESSDEDYDAIYAADTRTPSGRAFVKWLAARDGYLMEQAEKRIIGQIDNRQAKVKADQRLQLQVRLLKERRADAYSDDAAVQSLLEWASSDRDDALYLLAMAKDFSEGRLPLKRSTLQQLANVYKPNAGNNGNGGAATISDASEKPSSITKEDAQLRELFFDSDNISL